jgi:hypothetical protein
VTGSAQVGSFTRQLASASKASESKGRPHTAGDGSRIGRVYPNPTSSGSQLSSTIHLTIRRIGSIASCGIATWGCAA